ncbi:hypothetical protein P7C73_g1122, partial [Tremellales sp. Uapishka_1]
MDELLNRYAPIVKLSYVLRVWPPGLPSPQRRGRVLPELDRVHDPALCLRRDAGRYDLPCCTLSFLVVAALPANKRQDADIVNPTNLSHLPFLGSRMHLSLAEPHNPQPFLDTESEYLYGPAGQEGGMRWKDGRGWVREPVYGFWVDVGHGVVDLWYWTFYPFNLGKTIPPVGILGNHVGDWEHLRMRTFNGTAISVDYGTHQGDRFGAGTVRWEDVETIDGRPVAYSAAGSHGLWPVPGRHEYANLLNRWRLIDVTDDNGAIWDTKNHVVSSQYWDDPERRRKVWHDGDKGWLNFRGYWGNEGKNDCWWFKIIGICQVVGAPPGPNRNFGNPPYCQIAPLAWESSTYSFYLSLPVVEYAEDNGVSLIKVEQICAKPRKPGDEDDDGDDEDNEEEEEVRETIVGGVTEFVGRKKHVVKTLPCPRANTAVKSYRVLLCMMDGKCLARSGPRKICSYETGKKGYKAGNAVDLEDLDDWRWDL